ncbi:exonuclease domain-containing protein [Streptomyces sp. LZ34]
MTWHDKKLLAWDLETTGIDVETARIVTAAAVGYTPGVTIDSLPDHSRQWLANPGIDIPAGATAVHGITTEQAQSLGRPAVEVVDEIADLLAVAQAEGTPLVIMNARYDLTVLDRECRRHGLATVEERLGRPVGPVIDPLILDKAADKFRPGSRKLEALAKHYGVTLAAAHRADADALAAVEVAVAVGTRFEQLHVDAQQLHVWQIRWAAEQAAGLQAHKQKTDPFAVVEGAWPLVPYDALRGAFATLADRYEQVAGCATTELGRSRGLQLRRVAADIRDVLRTGRVPHALMTDAELEQHGTAQ